MSRDRHGRLESHFGTVPGTTIGLSSAIGGTSAGTSIEELLRELHLRLLVLEGATAYSFSVDATVFKVQPGSFTADAEIS